MTTLNTVKWIILAGLLIGAFFLGWQLRGGKAAREAVKSHERIIAAKDKAHAEAVAKFKAELAKRNAIAAKAQGDLETVQAQTRKTIERLRREARNKPACIPGDDDRRVWNDETDDLNKAGASRNPEARRLRPVWPYPGPETGGAVARTRRPPAWRFGAM